MEAKADRQQTNNSKQRHHTAPYIIAGYHTSKMQQTHLELVAAIVSKSGRRGLKADEHQKWASAGDWHAFFGRGKIFLNTGILYAVKHSK